VGTVNGFRVGIVADIPMTGAVTGTGDATALAIGMLPTGAATAKMTSLDTPHHEQNLASSGTFIPQDTHLLTISFLTTIKSAIIRVKHNSTR
jgi:hypothetical protein